MQKSAEAPTNLTSSHKYYLEIYEYAVRVHKEATIIWRSMNMLFVFIKKQILFGDL